MKNNKNKHGRTLSTEVTAPLVVSLESGVHKEKVIYAIKAPDLTCIKSGAFLSLCLLF